ncbi:MAG: 16S rRNA (cytosine(1402)-N(4))-methyltransferase RsmH [SAR324 cluster bacterium]|nr:16S rRNA (cytosine(1402)-N(4))-methyltransferase RsmH [SAR324 cluster bacterium]
MFKKIANHQPVMLEEVLNVVPPNGELMIDFTLGMGGHSEAILRENKGYRLIGFDRDSEAISMASQRLIDFKERILIKQAKFNQACDYLKKEKITASFILVDLGISSWQLDQAERGFAFSQQGPLDMRMDNTSGLSASDYVNQATYESLRQILREYGQEPFAARIAKGIVNERLEKKISTTTELADIVNKYKPKKRKKKGGRRHNQATLTFQAIRIHINDEINQLKILLNSLESITAPDSVVAVLGFHSLEDRLVKRRFAYLAKSCVCDKSLPVCRCRGISLVEMITKKCIKADEVEIESNPRSRSARLRVVKFK